MALALKKRSCISRMLLFLLEMKFYTLKAVLRFLQSLLRYLHISKDKQQNTGFRLFAQSNSSLLPALQTINFQVSNAYFAIFVFALEKSSTVFPFFLKICDPNPLKEKFEFTILLSLCNY